MQCAGEHQQSEGTEVLALTSAFRKIPDFHRSCNATVSGILFSEQSRVVPERGVPVMRTLRIALTTIRRSPAQDDAAVASAAHDFQSSPIFYQFPGN